MDWIITVTKTISVIENHEFCGIDNTALQNFFLKYTNDEYDHFLCFLAAESGYDIRFASSRLDLAVLELWILAFLLKSEKNILSASDL